MVLDIVLWHAMQTTMITKTPCMSSCYGHDYAYVARRTLIASATPTDEFPSQAFFPMSPSNPQRCTRFGPSKDAAVTNPFSEGVRRLGRLQNMMDTEYRCEAVNCAVDSFMIFHWKRHPNHTNATLDDCCPSPTSLRPFFMWLAGFASPCSVCRSAPLRPKSKSPPLDAS